MNPKSQEENGLKKRGFLRIPLLQINKNPQQTKDVRGGGTSGRTNWLFRAPIIWFIFYSCAVAFSELVTQKYIGDYYSSRSLILSLHAVMFIGFVFILFARSRRNVDIAILVNTFLILFYAADVTFFIMRHFEIKPEIATDKQSPSGGQRTVAGEGKEFRFPTLPNGSAADVIRALNNKGIDAVPLTFPFDYLQVPFYVGYKRIQPLPFYVGYKRIQPLSGISQSRVIFCDELGFFTEYQSDRYGFNNPDGIWDAEQIDVVALGDSFTHGACVRPKDGYVSLIRDEVSGTANLGFSSTGPLIQLATLPEYGHLLRPRVIAWFFFEGNDLQDLVNESKNTLLMKYVDSNFSQGLSNLQPQIDAALKERLHKQLYINEVAMPPTLSFVTHISNRILMTEVMNRAARAFPNLMRPQNKNSFLSAQNQETLYLLDRVYGRAAKEARELNAQIAFFYIPWESVMNNKNMDKERQAILDIAKRNGFHIMDLHSVISQFPEPSKLYIRHFNNEGNKVAAEAAIPLIRDLMTANAGAH